MAANLTGGSVDAVSSHPSPAVKLLLAAPAGPDRLSMQSLLHSWGYDVKIAEDSVSLLEALSADGETSILILDLGLSGLECLNLLHRLQLKTQSRRPWTVALSSKVEDSRRWAAECTRETAIDDLLALPVNEFELRVSLSTAACLRDRWVEMTDRIDAAHFQASHDSLTGLWRRESLLQLLFQETDRTQRLHTPLTFLLLDLDRFSQVNHQYGYDGGDRVLRQVASRFRRYLRSYDLAGRCGEDEFLIAMPGCTPEDAHSMATRLQVSITGRPFDILQAEVEITASFGIAHSHGRSPLVVLREAESALSRAKLAGGNCVRFYVPPGKNPTTPGLAFDIPREKQPTNVPAQSEITT